MATIELFAGRYVSIARIPTMTSCACFARRVNEFS
jgi:hypothetical protein